MPLEIEKKESRNQYHVKQILPGEEATLTHTQKDGSQIILKFSVKGDDSRTTIYITRPNSLRFKKLLVLEKGESFERPIEAGRTIQTIFIQR